MNSNFDFSKYYLSQEENEISPVIENPESKSSFNLNKYIVKDTQEQPNFESVLEYGRAPARIASRVIESALGLPGDIRDFIETTEKFTPELSFSPEMQTFFDKISEVGKKVTSIFPTSDELKKVSSYLTGGFTDPQGALEELGDEIVSLGTTLVVPMKNPQKLQTFFKALGKAGLTKAVGIGAEQFGATETQKNLAEMGTLLSLDFLSKTTGKYIDKFLGDQYKQARSKIPPQTMLDTSSLNSKLNSVEKTLKKGLPKTSVTKPAVLETINEIKSKTAGGAAEAEEILDSIHDINSKLDSKGLFQDLSTSQRKVLKKRYDDVKSILYDTLKTYGNSNPKFYKELIEYNKAYSILNKSRYAKNFILSNIKNFPKDIAAGLAFKLFIGGPVLPAAAGGIAAYRTGKLLNQVISSNKLRKFYIDAFKSAAKEDLPGLVKNLKSLDKGLKTEEALPDRNRASKANN